MKFSYNPVGVCARLMTFEVEDGCKGNLQGIGKLTEGMDIDEIIQRLQGIKCGSKESSCPDQLAKALTEAKAKL